MSVEHLEFHYEDLEKQTHAARFGMWVFIGSEALLFGALFALFAAYRVAYTESFREAAGHTDLLLGTLMTIVLISSSYAVAACIPAARSDRGGKIVRLLTIAVGLGILFLVLKGVEYTIHFRDGIFPGVYYRFAELTTPGAPTFFTLYYFMTGLHALHVIGGIGLLSWLGWKAHRGAWSSTYHTPLELGGMYWHFVDVVWIFLWPLFYLLR